MERRKTTGEDGVIVQGRLVTVVIVNGAGGNYMSELNCSGMVLKKSHKRDTLKTIHNIALILFMVATLPLIILCGFFDKKNEVHP